MKNYYEILEVDKKASKKIINGVYKLHIKENHPDLFQGEEKAQAEEKIKMFNEAYEVLKDDVKRKEYDKMLDEKLEDRANILEKENYSLRSKLEGLSRNDDNEIEKTYEKSSDEFILDEEVTHENNMKYMLKLINKDKVIKCIITICVVTAAGIGIYNSTGFNLFKVIWTAITKAFS